MTELDRAGDNAGTAHLSELASSSTALILQLQDDSGAYPASPTFSAYRSYSWFRDGSFIADAMSSVGESDSASRFFDWCSRILIARDSEIHEIVRRASAGEPVSDHEMLATRFTFAGTDGSEEWWDFQLDGYGTWLWAVGQHIERHRLDTARWLRAIELTVDYLVSSWRRPCYDWWEESVEEVHVSTLGCIVAGLAAAAPLVDESRAGAAWAAVLDIRGLIRTRGIAGGHLTKWLGTQEVDASLLAVIYPLDVFPATGSIGSATISVVDAQLNIDGGVHRYLRDTFYGGGQWPLLSCMLGLALNAAGDRDRALDQLRWAASTATAEGFLPEQVGEHLLDASMTAQWVDRWGGVATPLLWSHAMYIRLAVELGLA